jgi:hypothetical protein
MLPFDNASILKVIHLPENNLQQCSECGNLSDFIFLVVDGNRNIYTKEGNLEEFLVCPSCFNFQYALNPSRRGEPYH